MGNRRLTYEDLCAWLDAESEAVAQVEHVCRVVDVPEVDWDWESQAVNGVLRSMWCHVELDEQLLPVRAKWRVPEWRE